MTQPAMRFLYGDRELSLEVRDVIAAPVDVIVVPTDQELSHRSGLAAAVAALAGEQFLHDSQQLLREHGPIESGMAVYTGAGSLPYQAVIHAVLPAPGEGDAQAGIEQTISRSLQLCDMNEWRSVAFPALGLAESGVSIETCAQAFFRAITHFWDARQECAVEKVLMCLAPDQFRPFFDAFREQGIQSEELAVDRDATTAPPIGVVELSDEDIAELKHDDDEIDGWFK